MSTAAISGSTAAGQTATSGSAKSLDREAFLKLLITQLQNQDPMNPMEDRDFIAQLAQFSSLEQMQLMNSSLTSYGSAATAQFAFSLIGKSIDYADATQDGAVSGKVTGVTFQDGQPMLDVNDTQVDLSSLLKVY